MKKKQIFACFIISALMFVGTSCGTDSNETMKGQNEKTDFQIGVFNTSGHLLPFVAKEEGFFVEEGLNVTVNSFNSAAEQINALEYGKIDVGNFGSVPALTFKSEGHDLTVFGGTMSNGHAYMIKPESMEPGKSGLELLIDKNVAVPKYSVQDAELQILLKNAHIRIGNGKGEVHFVYFDNQTDCYAAMANQDIDACSVFSPFISTGEKQGYEFVYRCSEIDMLKNQPCCRQVQGNSIYFP